MPEAVGTPEVQTTVPQPAEHHHDHGHDVHVHTDHGEMGHVCDANCQHTQAGANEFADNLFDGLDHSAHGEAGHVCSANCQHTQERADDIANQLFGEAEHSHDAAKSHTHNSHEHGKSGHVCTAECKHTQQEADQFADDLFETVIKDASHGEAGHVCSANCKHTQEQADQLADELFAQAQQEKSNADRHAVHTSDSSRFHSAVEDQALEAVRAAEAQAAAADSVPQIRSGVGGSIAGGKSPGQPETKRHETQPEMEKTGLPLMRNPVRDFVQQKIEAVKGIIVADTVDKEPTIENPALPLVSETLTNESLDNNLPREVENGVAEAADKVISLETPPPSFVSEILPSESLEDILVDEIKEGVVEEGDDGLVSDLLVESETSVEEGVLEEQEPTEVTAVSFEASEWDEDAPLTVVAEPEISEEEVFTEHIAGDVSVEEPRIIAITETVIKEIPALTALEPALPTIAEIVSDFEDNIQQIEHAQEAIVEIRTILETFSGEEIDVFQKEQLIARVEDLAKTLNLKPEELIELLKLRVDDTFELNLAEEILLGLQKLLSVEFSDEFVQSSVSSTTQKTDVAHLMGQLLLQLFKSKSYMSSALAA